MKVIAVSGKAQSGKGTFISAVFQTYQLYNPNAKIIEANFADTLKDAVHLVFRIPKEDMYTTEGKEKYLPQFKTTVRDILQRFGTEGCRSIYENIWVWNLMEKIKEYERQGYDLVGVSDLRFQNEYVALKKIGAYTIKTVRPSYQIEQNAHQSEVDLDYITDWDVSVVTDDVNEVRKMAKIFTKHEIIPQGELV